ncbi:hypothetical protein BX265_3167 [Streptomyces sp. TLI_235]|nr:hypothetical protein [Streptomyces sp. TLI_235]PBC78400.1 hypothetical protein BX265_3167 [Streptomyces sp. TLI_235]
MTKTARSTAPATGLIPGQRPPVEPPVEPAADAPPAGGLAALRRAFAVARGLCTLRPVPARVQEPYGEVDGQ